MMSGKSATRCKDEKPGCAECKIPMVLYVIYENPRCAGAHPHL